LATSAKHALKSSENRTAFFVLSVYFYVRKEDLTKVIMFHNHAGNGHLLFICAGVKTHVSVC
jgi:hypothetical protein